MIIEIIALESKVGVIVQISFKYSKNNVLYRGNKVLKLIL